MGDEKPKVGTVGWFDLTVDDADGVRDFYKRVVGWESEDVDMGDYCDYTMTTPDGAGVGGVCHKRGGNKEIPSQWLIYIVVADIDDSVAGVKELGGEVIAGPKSMGAARYCIVRDPAGAAFALYQP
jgi:predicted enzyme related to lactoylglutathione lyase